MARSEGFADLVLDAPALRNVREETIRGMLGAAKRTVDIVTREYEKHLEAATKGVITQGNLYRAWASDIRPKGKNRIAREPAGFIYINGGERTRGAIAFLTESGRVQSQAGGYLAIPLPAAGSRGRGRNLTPGEWERQTGQRLDYVYRGANRPALLVARGTSNQRTGAYRAITRQRTAADDRRGFQRGEQSVPIFVLIAPFAFRARFSIETVLRGSASRMAIVFEQEARQFREGLGL